MLSSNHSFAQVFNEYSSVVCRLRSTNNEGEVADYRWRLQLSDESASVLVQKTGYGYSQVTSIAKELKLPNAELLDSFELVMPNQCSAIVPPAVSQKTGHVVSCRAYPTSMRFFSEQTGYSVEVKANLDEEASIQVNSSSDDHKGSDRTYLYGLGVKLPIVVNRLQHILFQVVDGDACQFK
jgi:hypothetical protein